MKSELSFMSLIGHEIPFYHTVGYSISEEIRDSVEEIFKDINKKIFEKEHVDLHLLYIDDSEFEANVNGYSWVCKRQQRERYCLFDKIAELFNLREAVVLSWVQNLFLFERADSGDYVDEKIATANACVYLFAIVTRGSRFYGWDIILVVMTGSNKQDYINYRWERYFLNFTVVCGIFLIEFAEIQKVNEEVWHGYF